MSAPGEAADREDIANLCEVIRIMIRRTQPPVREKTELLQLVVKVEKAIANDDISFRPVR